jgi:hypothetical protein
MRECPACGFKAEAVDNTQVAEGELVEITGRKKRGEAASKDEQAAFYDPIVSAKEAKKA